MIDENSPLFDLKCQVETALNRYGPLTGNELKTVLRENNYIELWKVCHQSSLLRVLSYGRYYLRYDITRENQLRLSPSVLRDFLSFSLIYLSDQRSLAAEKSARLSNKHRQISRQKMHVARKAILSLDSVTRKTLNDTSCVVMAGDVSYFLAHNELRLHEQSEVMVNGSDIDLVFIHQNDLSKKVIEAAEAQMLAFKHQALKDPSVAEEVDFIFKPEAKMLAQFRYDDIHQKIASKILYESFFLYGRLDIYNRLLADLEFSGALEKIEKDFDTALLERKNTLQKIFNLPLPDTESLDGEIQSLFYFSQERLEFR